MIRYSNSSDFISFIVSYYIIKRYSNPPDFNINWFFKMPKLQIKGVNSILITISTHIVPHLVHPSLNSPAPSPPFTPLNSPQSMQP